MKKNSTQKNNNYSTQNNNNLTAEEFLKMCSTYMNKKRLLRMAKFPEFNGRITKSDYFDRERHAFNSIKFKDESSPYDENSLVFSYYDDEGVLIAETVIDVDAIRRVDRLVDDEVPDRYVTIRIDMLYTDFVINVTC